MPDMRKDLRYGLGLGALLLVFCATYLIVRNYSEKHPEPEGPTVATGGEAQAPEANPATPLAAAEGAAAPNRSATLPPLPPATQSGRPPIVPAPQTVKDPFRRTENGELSASAKTNTAQDWDRLLEQGRTDPLQGQTGGATPPRVPSVPRSGTNSGRVTRPPTTVIPPAIHNRTGRPYTIKEGDTFVSIARTAYGNSKYFHQIEQANPEINPSRMRPGQQIILPELTVEERAAPPGGPFAGSDNRPIKPGLEYRVDTGDSLYRISMKLYGTPNMMDALYEANKAAIGPSPERLRFGMILKLPKAVSDNK
jgi:nucleoid-associated protein YgaU